MNRDAPRLRLVAGLDSGRYERWSLWSWTLGRGPFPRRTVSLSSFSRNESQRPGRRRWHNHLYLMLYFSLWLSAAPLIGIADGKYTSGSAASGERDTYGGGRGAGRTAISRPGISAGRRRAADPAGSRCQTGGVVFGSWSGIDPLDPPVPFGFLGLDHLSAPAIAPRTVWACQPKAATISSMLAPLVRFSMAMSCACLLSSRVRRDFSLAAFGASWASTPLDGAGASSGSVSHATSRGSMPCGSRKSDPAGFAR